MSYKIIDAKRYECTCDAHDKNGEKCGYVWLADEIPTRCSRCKRPTWNGSDRRVKVVLTHKGKSQSVQKWAKELGISSNTIYQRIWRKWPTEDVLSADMFSAGRKPKDS